MAKKPVNIEVIEENGERFLLTTYNDGTLVRCRVDPNQKPKRKPRLNSSATEQQRTLGFGFCLSSLPSSVWARLPC